MITDKERKESIGEKHGVIFAIVNNGIIQLENRIEEGHKFFGYTLIPGGGIEANETQHEALTREVREEYGVEAKVYKKIGIVDSIEKEGLLNFRHVYLVSDWNGKLSNPEARNEHIEATLEEARKLCEHPISQQILDLVEEELSSQNI